MSIVLFYDLETTGLPKRGDDPLIQPGIIEIGAVLVDTDEWDKPYEGSLTKTTDRVLGIFKTFEMKVNPELPRERWEPGASKANGVYFGDRDDCPSFFTAGRSFAQFAVGAEYVSGYNIVGFDNKILMWQLLRYGMQFHFPWPPNHVDVMDLAKKSGQHAGARGAKAPKLINLYAEMAGEPLKDAHTALADIRATVFCAKGLANGAF